MDNTTLLIWLKKKAAETCHDKYEGHGVGHDRIKPLCIFDEEGQPISLRDIDSPRKRSWQFDGNRPTAQI